MKTFHIILICICLYGCVSVEPISLGQSYIHSEDAENEENKSKCQLNANPNRISCLTMDSIYSEGYYKFDDNLKFDSFDDKFVCCHVTFRVKASPSQMCSYIKRNENGWNDLHDMIDDNGGDAIKIWCGSFKITVNYLLVAFMLMFIL